MKLILAIVNNEDASRVQDALTRAGFFITRLSTTGGFLMMGNTTFLIGTDDEAAPKAIEILREHCTTRKQYASSTSSFGMGMKHMAPLEEVNVGGATIFVLDVNHMEKI